MRFRLLVGLPIVVVLLLIVFTLTPCIARCGGADDVVTEAVRACPDAVKLLGSDPSPARMGMACGTTETQGAYGRASWSMPYSGSRARGTVEYAAEKRGGDWQLDAATLEVDGETVDLVACLRMQQPRNKPVLAQTNADAATAVFDGKVIRSTHPTIAKDALCKGSLARERGSPFAKVKVTCGAAEGSPLYDGTGNFTMEVGNPASRSDDRSEYDDSKTSEADQTPGCRLSSAGGKGTLTIWDSNPAYELVVEL